MSERTAARTSSPTAPGSVATFVGAGLLLALVVVVLGNTSVGPGENGGLWPGVVTGVGCIVLAGLLYRPVRDRWHGSARATFVLGILAVVTMIVFWSGVPLVLAGAGAATGAPAGSRAALVGRILAALAASLHWPPP